MWKLHAIREVALTSQYDPDRVRALVAQYAGNHATDCSPAEGAPARVKVSVNAHAEDDAFAITVDSNNQPFATCLVGKLQDSMRDAYKVSRKLPDGKYERYFRIDRDVAATVELSVETPEARQERSRKLEIEMENRRHDHY